MKVFILAGRKTISQVLMDDVQVKYVVGYTTEKSILVLLKRRLDSMFPMQ
jgi:hypothetical protein